MNIPAEISEIDPEMTYRRQCDAAIAVSDGRSCHVKRNGTVTSVSTGERLGRVWKDGRAWRGTREEVSR